MASLALIASACGRHERIQVLTESTRLERSKPAPDESAVFDGRTVRLRGARGETLGLEVRVENGTKQSVSLDLPPAAAAVSGFSVGSLEVREPSTDMYGPSSGPGTYPDILVPAEGAVEANDLAYFDVAIPSAATPGRYEGALGVGSTTVRVVLDVSRARIDLLDKPLVWVFYSPGEIARVSGLADEDTEALIAKEAEYDALFRAHGAYLASDVLPQRFEARRRFVHDVAYWPVAVDTSSDAAIRRDVERWLEIFSGSDVTPFAIPVDEPRTGEQKGHARHVADVMGEAGAGRPRLLRSVTDAAAQAYADSMDVFISPKNIPAVERERSGKGERFWTYNGKPPEAGSMTVDTEGAALRTWGWIAERYGIELWYAWEGLYFSDRYNHGGPTDVMHDPVTFDERSKGGTDWGNGDGLLAYPGGLASLRLKILRRGLEDRLLLRELADCGYPEEARDIARRTVPRALGEALEVRSWPATEVEWEKARADVLDAIEARCHEDA